MADTNDDFTDEDTQSGGGDSDPAESKLAPEHPHRPTMGQKTKGQKALRQPTVIPTYPLQHAARPPRI